MKLMNVPLDDSWGNDCATEFHSVPPQQKPVVKTGLDGQESSAVSFDNRCKAASLHIIFNLMSRSLIK